ncbi:unnamed protein product [Microthlaspi erraticum]|uniref:F-box domain-containing protein n=1 Tax=Microthlaspi erraticum TaxID=1685480 RepID=A0A6D2HY63_9BRAS|nr:unnamed protein product [Microthlaspi erraticum]CAA7021170.1 unnamed protein product [Microthlaspi erraticum]CAA7034081.1 unnamed protein product [Microthlaspi erraticum]
MPDEILLHILSFVPTEDAITTSVLSRRWRHVWCWTHSLEFQDYSRRTRTVQDINQTLISYKAPKITSFLLHMTLGPDVLVSQMDSWIEFAMSRNVEELSLSVNPHAENYSFPDVFYLSSSLEQLSLTIGFYMIPRCTVSWKSLKNLSLTGCFLKDESFANILSGCPVLESLNFHRCYRLPKRLDLSKSPSLKRLEIYHQLRHTGPMETLEHKEPVEIIAPHILYLNLSSSEEPPFTLVDVSSLTEASLDICIRFRPFIFNSKAHSLQTMVLKMLAKLQSVERLSFDGTFLQILSLAELRGVPFPTLSVQTLTLVTKLTRSVVPGIQRLLQNSPRLKKLIAKAANPADMIKDRDMDSYLDSQGLNPDQCWSSKYELFPTSYEFRQEAMSKLVASFIEMLLRNVNTLETLVVVLKYIRYDAKRFEELLQTLSNNNNVSIVFKR